MFGKLKLRGKIGGGFALLIVISVCVGVLSVWSMMKVKENSTQLCESEVPTLDITFEVERDIRSTMYYMRAYSESENAELMTDVYKHLKEVQDDLKRAKDHGTQHNEKEFLASISRFESGFNEYEQTIRQTVSHMEEAAKCRQNMTEAAGAYMKECGEYLANQDSKFKEELKTDLRKSTSQPQSRL